MSTGEIALKLRNTGKGKLSYERETSSKKIKSFLKECSSPPSLQVSPKFSHNIRSQTLDGGKENIEQEEDQERIFAVETTRNRSSDTRSCNEERKVKLFTSPEFETSRLAICKYEEELGNKARKARLWKQQQFEDIQNRIEQDAQHKVQEIEQKAYFDTLMKTQDMHLRNESKAAEIVKQHRRMKETHEQRKQIHDAKIQEAEQTKRKLQMEEIKRKEKENKERHEKLAKCVTKLNQLFTKVQADFTANRYQSHISDAAKKSVDLLQTLVGNAEAVRRGCQGSGSVTMEDCEQCGDILDQGFKTYEFIMKELGSAEEEGKEADAERVKQNQIQQAQIEAAAAVGTPLASSTPLPQSLHSQPSSGQAQITTSQLSAAAASKDESLCVDIEAFRVYTQLQNKLLEVEKITAVFSSTPELKKFKFDIQKAVNTSINAISPVSGNHLRDKLKRLLQLLSCQPIEVSGRTVRLDQHPQGPVFCKQLIARMIVKKGEEQVSSKHESAFAIGMVAAGLWRESPSIGELLLAHFHALCPYLVPFYIPRQEGQSDTDFFRSRGYRYEDGVIEKHDKFLKRMSGIMRLFFSIIVSAPPRGEHPHGLDHAWQWLTRVLNMDPEPDITCTMIYDCLQVTGHALCQVYNKQFLKLLHILMKEMLPKLKNVSSNAGGGAWTRLQLLLETSVKHRGNIPLPDGFIEKNFWLS